MNDKAFQIKATDWRATLAKNQRRTFIVIGLFIAIYLSIGLLVDLYIHAGIQPEQSLTNTLYALMTFQITPMATLTMGIVAIVSLIITYAFHDQLILLGTNYREVKQGHFRDLTEEQLYNVVEELKIASSMRYMPKIYIIEADYMNAFASGYSEKSALIAITRGLIHKLNRAELQAVMAHELSHIRHGDIKLTLTASVLSNIMLMVIDLLFYNMIFGGRRNNRAGGNKLAFVIILLRYLLPLITILLMLYLSRTREYMADAGSVELLRDNHPLGRALIKIAGDHDNNTNRYNAEYGNTKHEDVRRAAYIFDPQTAGIHPIKSISSLFSTHPTIKNRLKAINFVE